MAQITVDTRATAGGATEVDVHGDAVTVQNKDGTAIVAVSLSPNVDPGVDGIELAADEFVKLREFHTKVYLASDVDGADVRYERF